MLQRSKRAGRFTMSKSACKEVRQAVTLAEELGLRSVDVRGVRWTLNHNKHQRNFSSGQRGRAMKVTAEAAVQAQEGDKEVPVRESRPPNRRQRRSRKRLDARIQMHEAARARYDGESMFEQPAAVPQVDDMASSLPIDEAMSLHELAREVDEEHSQERSRECNALPLVVDASASAVRAGCPAVAVSGPDATTCGHPSTDGSEPPTPPREEIEARQAARRLSEACELAAEETSEHSTPHHKRRRRRHLHTREAPLGLPRG